MAIERDQNRRRYLLDAIAVGSFLLYSLMYFLGRWAGMAEFNFLESDIANSTGFAAAVDRPELFVGDGALGDSENLRLYWVLQGYLIRGLTRFTADYGLSACFLLGPHIFLQLIGFYVLGIAFFRDRIWAFMLAVFSTHFVPFKLGDFWGIYYDILPRFTFQAIFPFLLAYAYYVRAIPARWPLVMILAGILIYIHPVSAPGVGFAVWLGLWAFHPREWPVGKRLFIMFGLGSLFLLVTAPFMVNYLGAHEHGATVDYDLIYPILVERFAPGFFDIPYGILRFFQHMHMAGFFFPGLVCIPLLLWMRWREGRREVLLVVLWLSGIFLIGMLVPYVEQEVAKAYRAIPPEIDLIRTIRYSIPLTMLLVLWFIYETVRRLQVRLGKVPLSWLVGIPALYYVTLNFGPTWGYPKRTYEAWKSGVFVPDPLKGWEDVNKNVQAIRRYVPETGKIFVAGGIDELVVRYSALRPVVFSYKDGGLLGYTDHAALLRWKGHADRYRNGLSAPDPLQEMDSLARELGAEYLVVPWGSTAEAITRSKAFGRSRLLYEHHWEDRYDQGHSMSLLQLL